MKRIPISAGGQIALPAAIRRRWGSRQVELIDQGDRVVLRPVPDDPVGAAAGSLRAYGRPGTAETRAMLREEEAEAERRRSGG